MTAECSSRRKLSEFVSDHVLRDKYGNVLSSVMDGESVSDHVGSDRRSAAPCFNESLLASAIHVENLLHKVVIDKETFL